MAEVTWIRGHIPPPHDGEYYVALEAQTDCIEGFQSGDVRITGDYWQDGTWMATGNANPFWKVLCWADVLKPDIPDSLRGHVKDYFGFKIDKYE